MDIVFMGTPDFAVPSLLALHEAGYNIKLVVTQEDRRRGRGKKFQPTEIKAKALELGLEVYQPANINDDESIERIRSCKPDFIVVAAYGQILKRELLDIAKYDIINVHASLLPKYRGAAPINWSIVNGEKETGITIMEIEEGLDTGAMILQEAIEIEEDDDASIIHDQLAELGGKMIVKAIEGIVDGSLEREPQDDSKHSYAPTLSRESGRIDWSMTAREIRNLVRGFKPWPSAFTDYKDETVKIHWLEALEGDYDGENGEIIRVGDEELIVKVGDGAVSIKELQFPGKRKMKIEDYLRGNEIEEGVILK